MTFFSLSYFLPSMTEEEKADSKERKKKKKCRFPITRGQVYKLYRLSVIKKKKKK